MPELMCRLCLNDKELINIFDRGLTNSDLLRKYILLGTGVEICPNDTVTKYVCRYCHDIAVFLYKYRKKALENDKALKEFVNQKFVEPLQSIDGIAQYNNVILKDLASSKDDELSIIKPCQNQSQPREIPLVENFAVHPTIVELFRAYPNAKIPNELLKCHIQPQIVLNTDEVKNWEPKHEKKDNTSQLLSDIERFQKRCPAIQIKRVTQTFDQDHRKASCTKAQSLDSIINKRKLSLSPDNVSKKKKVTPTSFLEVETSEKTSKKRQSNNLVRSANEPLQNLNSEKPSLTDYRVVATSSIKSENDNDIQKILAQNKEITCTQVTSDHIKENSSNDSDSELNTNSDSHNMYSLLVTIEEEIIVSCGTCGKMFNTQQQLSSHERIHRRCTICKNMFRSADVLFIHQQEICFKTVIANPPNLELVRVDEQPEIRRLYPEVFNSNKDSGNKPNDNTDVLYISDDDDDDIILIDETSNDTNQTLDAQCVIDLPEQQHICRIFDKYKNIKLPYTKCRATETTKLRPCVKFNAKKQLVLEGMYSQLETFRVPIELLAKSTFYASITYNKKASQQKGLYSWASKPVIELSDKKLNLPTSINTSNSINCFESNSSNTLQPNPPTSQILCSTLQQTEEVTQSSFTIKVDIPKNYITTTGNTQNSGEVTPSTSINVATNLDSTPICVKDTRNQKKVTPSTSTDVATNLSSTPICVNSPTPICVDSTQNRGQVTPSTSTNVVTTLGSTPICVNSLMPICVDSTQNREQATPSTSTNVAIKLGSTSIYVVSKPTPVAIPTNSTTPTTSTNSNTQNGFGLRVKTLSKLL
ncbi:hypothetical protein Trydic_g11849 [Trypoxylus dichotomus]